MDNVGAEITPPVKVDPPTPVTKHMEDSLSTLDPSETSSDSAKLTLQLTTSHPLTPGFPPKKIDENERRSSSGKRKLSESRGVTLPNIKIIEPNRENLRSVNSSTASDSGYENSGPPYSAGPLTASPLGYVLRHRRQLSASGDTTERLSRASLKLRVYLPDHRWIDLTIEAGRAATCSVLFAMLRDQMVLDAEIMTDAFALWMISPLLEIQLKPHHVPFQVRKYWVDLLQKFTIADSVASQLDEPVLVLKRNVLLGSRRETEILDMNEKALELLMIEARECVLTGKYPCELNRALTLAAMDMALTWGPYNPSKHTQAYIRDSLEDFVPDHYLRQTKSWSLFGWSLVGCKGLENQILAKYRSFSSNEPRELRKKYLNLCMELPFYGSAFFSGQIEKPPKGGIQRLRLPSGSSDLPVSIAINRRCISIIDPAKCTVLLLESIWDCLWRKVNSPDATDPDLLPSFFLHFPDPEATGGQKLDSDGNPQENDSQRVEDFDPQLKCNSKLLQIFSRQAVMMEALLNSCIDAECLEEEMMEAELENGNSVTGRGIDSVDKNNEEANAVNDLQSEMAKLMQEFPSSPVLSNKLNKLCLATFNQDGECIEAVGSLEEVLKP